MRNTPSSWISSLNAVRRPESTCRRSLCAYSTVHTVGCHSMVGQAQGLLRNCPSSEGCGNSVKMLNPMCWYTAQPAALHQCSWPFDHSDTMCYVVTNIHWASLAPPAYARPNASPLTIFRDLNLFKCDACKRWLGVRANFAVGKERCSTCGTYGQRQRSPTSRKW